MPSDSYVDFDLLVDGSGPNYRVAVIDSPAGEASHTFTLPFSDKDLEILVLQVFKLTSRRSVRAIGSPEMKDVRSFGGHLFESLFSGPINTCLLRSMDEADRRHRGLRVRLRLGSAPGLTNIPWEFLYDSSADGFLCLSDETPVVRYIDLPQRVEPLAAKPPLRMLCLISSPAGYPTLDVEREWAKLNEALSPTMTANRLVMERVETPSLEALQRKLRRDTYHVLHFVGHGAFDQQAQDGVLLFEDLDGRGNPVTGESLGVLLHDHDSLRLVVLNACEGARTSSTDPFAGTAQSLVRKGIPAVIAMQFEISDVAAITLANEFYSAIADGYPVDAALCEARKAIFTRVNAVEWATPVLYMRAPDGRIFDIEAPAPRVAPPAPPPAEEEIDRGDLPFQVSATSEGDPSVGTREPGNLRVREQPRDEPVGARIQPQTGDAPTVPAHVVHTRRRRWWPLALLVGVGLVIALIALLLPGGSKTVSVPDVVGLSAEQASARLKDAGFFPQTESRESDEPGGTVLSMDPVAGMKLKSGSTIRLFISTGPQFIVVPDVRGESAGDARRQLEQLGFKLAKPRHEYDRNLAAGTVLRTDPPAGSKPTKSSVITLFVSAGPQYYVEAVLRDKPIAYWRFNEKVGASIAQDSAGQSEGTYHLVQLRQPGALNNNKQNTAASFDGINSYVDIQQVELGGDFTVEVWVKLNGSGSNTDGIIGQAGTGPDLNFAGGKLRLFIGQFVGDYDPVIAQTAAEMDKWTYWVITRSNGNLAIYRDAKLDATGTSSYEAIFHFRAIGWGNAGILNGYLDELAVYPRALTPELIKEHFRIANR